MFRRVLNKTRLFTNERFTPSLVSDGVCFLPERHSSLIPSAVFRCFVFSGLPDTR
jgi:hypothetical protein